MRQDDTWHYGRASQEVRREVARRNVALRLGHRAEDLRLAVVRRPAAQHCRDVPAPIAVVGRRPHRNQLVAEHVLVACKRAIDQFVHILVHNCHTRVIRKVSIYYLNFFRAQVTFYTYSKTLKKYSNYLVCLKLFIHLFLQRYQNDNVERPLCYGCHTFLSTGKYE